MTLRKDLPAPEGARVEGSLLGLSEERAKQLLILLIAGVALFGTVVGFLHVDSGSRAARASRDGRAYTLKAIGKSEAGVLRYLYERDRLAAHQALVMEWVLKRRLAQERDSLAAAQIDEQAAARLWQVLEQARALSGILSPPYFDEATFTADVVRFGADYLVVPPTLTVEKEAAKREEAGAWSAKNERYVVTVTVVAVSLFLFGLALTVRGGLRSLFFIVGVAIATASLAFVLATVVVAVPHVPEESMVLYATGIGDTYYAEVLSLGAAYAQIPAHADQAIESFTKAIALRPAYGAAYQARGEARLLKAEALFLGGGQGASAELDGSIHDFERAVRLGRRDRETWSRLSFAYFLEGRYPEAVDAARTALALAPDLRLRLCLNLVLGLLGQGKPSEAREVLEGGLSWAQAHPLASDALTLRAAIHGIHELGAARPLPGFAGVERRLKEASVALLQLGTVAVEPTAAQVGTLVFETLSLEPEGGVVAREPAATFPPGTAMVGLSFDYQGIPLGALVVLKVYWQGLEQPSLTQVERWTLPAAGHAERTIRSAFEYDFAGLVAGRYAVEVYVESNLVADGEFTIR